MIGISVRGLGLMQKVDAALCEVFLMSYILKDIQVGD